MTPATSTAHGTSPVGRRYRFRSALRAGISAALVGAVLNSVIYGVAHLAGADFVVTRSGATPMTVGLALVLATTLGSVGVGTIALVLSRTRAPTAWRILTWVGLAVALLTLAMPLSVEATASTQASLALMHLTTGAAFGWAVRRAVVGHAPGAVAAEQARGEQR